MSWCSLTVAHNIMLTLQDAGSMLKYDPLFNYMKGGITAQLPHISFSLPVLFLANIYTYSRILMEEVGTRPATAANAKCLASIMFLLRAVNVKADC